MKILIIRHGDPDYSIDSLTEKGWKEAEYLSEKIAPLPIKAYYVSPLGRAKDTGVLYVTEGGKDGRGLRVAEGIFATGVKAGSGKRAAEMCLGLAAQGLDGG